MSQSGPDPPPAAVFPPPASVLAGRTGSVPESTGSEAELTDVSLDGDLPVSAGAGRSSAEPLRRSRHV